LRIGRFGMSHVVDDDVRALPCQFEDDGEADSAVASGDDGDLAFEIHGLLLVAPACSATIALADTQRG
jgi:hypothetical protein